MTDDTLADEIAASEDPDAGPRRMLATLRARMQHRRWLRVTYKVVVTLVGGAVTATGVLLLVLPGPGWLLIFLGLGILGTEFPVVRRLTDRMKAVVLRVWARWRDRRASRAAAPAPDAP